MRCGRPFCAQCLREAPVGFQCVECAGAASRTPGRRPRPVAARHDRTVVGARVVTRSLMVPALVALNLAVFLYTVGQAGSLTNNQAAPLFQNWALVVPAVVAGQWWRLVTAGFLHFGPIHLLFNMVALWVIGKELEPVLGRTRFLAVYFVSLVGGSAATLLFSGLHTATAGASGAVFGLMGALAVLLRRLRLSVRPAVTLIVVNLVLSVVVPNISLSGHLGGLLTGGVATAGLVYAPARRRALWQAVWFAVLFGLVALVIDLRVSALVAQLGL